GDRLHVHLARDAAPGARRTAVYSGGRSAYAGRPGVRLGLGSRGRVRWRGAVCGARRAPAEPLPYVEGDAAGPGYLHAVRLAQVSGQTVPRLELFLDETAVMPLAQLLLVPEDAIVRMARASSARDDIYGLPDENTEPALEWKKVMTKQALLAAPPALMLLTL